MGPRIARIEKHMLQALDDGSLEEVIRTGEKRWGISAGREIKMRWWSLEQ